MANKDYYSILGVSKTASADEIKKAFRRLAHEHHPDKGGDAQKFKDINDAYQIIGDSDKRAKYDQFGSAAFDPNAGFGGGGGGFGGFGDFGGFNVNMEDMGDLGDILGGMFGFGGGGGGGRGRGGKKRGADIETEVSIEFLEAVKGVRKTVKLYKHDACTTCHGNGATPGSKVETCSTCKGRGQVMQQTRTMLGTFQTAVTCNVCHGAGSRATSPCTTCSGSGVERKQKEITIDIPAGISNGEGLKVTGEGEYPGNGGQSGDLYVRVTLKPHAIFSRENSDVVSTVFVPFSLLALGGETKVDTVDGDGSLKIPAGTSAGTVFKIRNLGFPYLRSTGRGDHLVTVQPSVPTHLSAEQKKILEQLQASGI